MNQNPWTFTTPRDTAQNTTLVSDPDPLPLPPNSSHPKWKNRCYNCLEFGHDQNDCTSEDRVCARCWMAGHMARDCHHTPVARRQRFDPLRPRGNMGDALLPANRPKATMVYIPETQHINSTNNELTRAIIIDARLRPDHCYMTLQPLLMAACNSALPLPLTHIADTRYLLLLAPGTNREQFLSTHGNNLQALSLVAYPWSMGMDATGLGLKFKAWIELKKLSPHQWNLDHLIPAVSSFGVVLEHSSMQNVRSMEKMMAVIALTDLSLIPMRILFWERGLLRDVEVIVHSWLEEPIPNSPEPDATPPASLFNEVQTANLRAVAGLSTVGEGSDTITIQFDTLFAIWSNLPAGDSKNELEATLRRNPIYFERETARVQAILRGTTVPEAAPSPGNSGTDIIQNLQLEAPILRFNGEEAANLILRSINCDGKQSEHASDGEGLVHPTGQTAPLTTPLNSGLGQRVTGKDPITFPLILGQSSNSPTNWADLVELENSTEPNAVRQGDKNPSLIEISEGPQSQTSAKTTTQNKQRKRGRKRAKKAVILTDLRRSARISERPATLLYTPKPNPKKGGEPSRATLIAKTADEAQIIQSLRDEVISVAPLEASQILQINKFCGLTETAGPDPISNEDPPTGLNDPISGEVPRVGENLEPAEVEEPEEDSDPVEVEDPDLEQLVQRQDEPMETDLASSSAIGEVLEDGECVLTGIDFDSDEEFLNSEEEEGGASSA